MTAAGNIPTCEEVRWILAAASDVIFSDGVPEEFLDQWADETIIMLSVGESVRATPSRHRSG